MTRGCCESVVPAEPELEGWMAKASFVGVKAVKVTLATEGRIETPSVTSVAEKTTAPEFTELTVKVSWPLELDVPDAAPIVTPVEGVAERVTVFPETGFPYRSFTVTVTRSVAPFAATALKAAVTVDVAAWAGPGVAVSVNATTVVLPAKVAIRVLVPASVPRV